MVDFVRDGRVGDVVKHPYYGSGVIVYICKGTETSYPVIVRFDKGNYIAFTKDGREFERNAHPTLCFENGNSLVDQGTPPPRDKPKKLEFTGKPVWAYVGKYETTCQHKKKRLVVASGKDGYYAIDNGGTNTKCTGILEWKFAWEIPAEDR